MILLLPNVIRYSMSQEVRLHFHRIVAADSTNEALKARSSPSHLIIKHTSLIWGLKHSMSVQHWPWHVSVWICHRSREETRIMSSGPGLRVCRPPGPCLEPICDCWEPGERVCSLPLHIWSSILTSEVKQALSGVGTFSLVWHVQWPWNIFGTCLVLVVSELYVNTQSWVGIHRRTRVALTNMDSINV